MSIAVRSATTTWQGDLASGTGVLGETSSGALDDQQVTWASRTEAPGGKSSPEELLAAAHSSCFSMALALTLGEHKVSPQRLTVTSEVALDPVDGVPTITTSKITVRAQVPGIDSAAFDAIIDEASKLCPVSRLFAGATITVDAQLED
ncbi:Organic hydroperoxide resistance protein [Microbacterium esteraromaticum]|uniref:Organic hydroperoxide resistance protein n=1 Tax=Microbacterium esteraromaticum TaxID=57043 RepID=A0A1R4J9K3_9MICO|nr:OsmC family peroxiredoxin [Microbacterium esteraromaticum]SJN28594.1 Organic hydroperoxide resistance protein [Microbacterium esteraromaticum]